MPCVHELILVKDKSKKYESGVYTGFEFKCGGMGPPHLISTIFSGF